MFSAFPIWQNSFTIYTLFTSNNYSDSCTFRSHLEGNFHHGQAKLCAGGRWISPQFAVETAGCLSGNPSWLRFAAGDEHVSHQFRPSHSDGEGFTEGFPISFKATVFGAHNLSSNLELEINFIFPLVHREFRNLQSSTIRRLGWSTIIYHNLPSEDCFKHLPWSTISFFFEMALWIPTPRQIACSPRSCAWSRKR